MSEAPELLWLWPAEPEDGVDKFVSFPGQPYPSGSTTYIRADVVRADLSDALLREAMEALGAALLWTDEEHDVADFRDAAEDTLAKLREHMGETE